MTRLNGFLVALFVIFVFAASAQKSSGEQIAESSVDVFIPNAFTPNGDGINDSFKTIVNGPELDIYEFSIIDRNGKEVFSSKNPDEFWDGTIDGSSYSSSPTIFIYIMKVKSIEDPNPLVLRGHVVMIR